MRRAAELIGDHRADVDWQVAGALADLASKERHREHSALTQNKERAKKISIFEASLRRLRAAIARLPEPLRSRALKAKGLDHICEDWLAICEHLRKSRRPAKPKRDDAFFKRAAAKEALRLLTYYDAKDVDARKSGRYCRLAAVLYLDPKADLSVYCRDQIKLAKPGAK